MGFIYILSNGSMPGLLKIGYTTRTVRERVQELNRPTGVPIPFKVEAYFQLDSPEAHERRVHLALTSCREGKEFFRIDTEAAKAKVVEICQTEPAKEGWLSVLVGAVVALVAIFNFFRWLDRRLHP